MQFKNRNKNIQIHCDKVNYWLFKNFYTPPLWLVKKSNVVKTRKNNKRLNINDSAKSYLPSTTSTETEEDVNTKRKTAVNNQHNNSKKEEQAKNKLVIAKQKPITVNNTTAQVVNTITRLFDYSVID